MEKSGGPDREKEQQHSDEEELEDLKAPPDSQEEVEGGCAATVECGVTCKITSDLD